MCASHARVSPNAQRGSLRADGSQNVESAESPPTRRTSGPSPGTLTSERTLSSKALWRSNSGNAQYSVEIPRNDRGTRIPLDDELITTTADAPFTPPPRVRRPAPAAAGTRLARLLRRRTGKSCELTALTAGGLRRAAADARPAPPRQTSAATSPAEQAIVIATATIAATDDPLRMFTCPQAHNSRRDVTGQVIGSGRWRLRLGPLRSTIGYCAIPELTVLIAVDSSRASRPADRPVAHRAHAAARPLRCSSTRREPSRPTTREPGGGRGLNEPRRIEAALRLLRA